MMGMTPALKDLVITRLVATGADNKPWGLHIVAAIEGPAALDAYLDSTSTPTAIPKASGSASSGGPKVEPPGVYVSSISVEGFRGIGDAVTLAIPTGPGLVLVVGRNGSGKSSFAEGLELLLTGRNFRWEKRTKVWKEGWRNLHQHESVSSEGGPARRGPGHDDGLARVEDRRPHRQRRDHRPQGRVGAAAGVAGLGRPARRVSGRSFPTTSWARCSTKGRRNSTTR